MSLRADQIFLFVGAGASAARPTRLPIFKELRNAILSDLRVDEYVANDESPGSDPTPAQLTASDLAPEAFMYAISQAGVPLSKWLRQALTPAGQQFNVAHSTIAKLAERGARVWTANFDECIEQSAPERFAVGAWPNTPQAGDQLLKPHGNLAGEMIVTSAQVLKPLEDHWLARLRQDIKGRIAIFLGYSANDLDFQPLWNDMLRDAPEVHWFDQGESRIARLLHDSVKRDAVNFHGGDPTPTGEFNPSWNFVDWCRQQQLVDLSDKAAGALLEQTGPPRRDLPHLPRRSWLARGCVLELLGEIRRARRWYALSLIQPRTTLPAVKRIRDVVLNYGGRNVARALVAAKLLPRRGPDDVRARLERKRLSILANVGDHETVLRLTDESPPDIVSTSLILRSAALRYVASIDESLAIADSALLQALRERHPVRVANASLQRGISLMWAYRLDEASTFLSHAIVPYATRAGNRWVAWSNWLDGCLALYASQTGSLEEGRRALDLLKAAERGFRADALIDGVVSVLTVRLMALRSLDQDAEFHRTRQEVRDTLRHSRRQGTYYTLGHAFARETIAFEDAEFARIHGDLPSAAASYRVVAASSYRIHVALGNIGLAALAKDRQRAEHLAIVRALSQKTGARLFEKYANDMSDQAPDETTERQFFLPS